MDNFLHHQDKEPWLKQAFSYVLEIVKVFLIALAIVVPVRYFLIQPFYVKGASMEPNFYDHEYLIIDEISYRLGDVKRGDVIVFKYPRNPKQFYIKRVVGLPGETVTIKEDGVYIKTTDGEEFKYDETAYLDDTVRTQAYNYSEVTLEDGQYFVMGDNRPASYDSRHFGPVSQDFIIGKAMLRVLPVDRFKLFTTQ